MDRMDGQKRREALRGGMFFILLALVLFFVTTIGFFTNLSPKNSLFRAMEKTEKELLKNDSVLLFIKDAFRSGEILFSGEEGEVYHTAELPEGANLKFTKDKENLTFSSSKDQILVTASFLEESYGASRQGAADLVSDSAFSDAGIGEEWLLLLSTYLSLTEKEGLSTEALSDFAAAIWDAASPSFTVKNAENGGGKEYLYQISSEGLALALSALSEEGKNEALQGEISSILSFAAALSDEDLTPEKKKACLSFLTGEGESFDAFSKKLSTEDAKGTVSFSVKSGGISSIDLRISGSDLSLHGQITFSENLKKDGGISVLFDCTEGEEKIFSLSLSHKITENSDSAQIRHWNFQIEDGKKLFLSEKDRSSGEMTFSWGKKKGDLGLRLTLSEKEIGLRGAVGEYKSGKRLNFTVKRIEIGRRNVLSSPLEVEMTKGGNLPAFEKGERELFCQGAEREEISVKLKESLSEIFLNKE